jgi:glycosyltransferase involved in cell wall biosynthesis
MTSPAISGVVIAFNEEANIARCIDSMTGVVDEVVVVDSYSSDRTAAICEEKGARVLQRPFDSYGSQKAFAAEQALHDIVLSLDADEVLSERLRQAVAGVKVSWQADGYVMNRLTNYCGTWIRHGGWYPDRQLRLWDRRRGQWSGAVHERVAMAPGARVERLDGDLLHYSFPTIQSHIDTLSRYSEMAAADAHAKGRRAGVLVHVILNPLYTFFNKYVLRLGFLDGYYGLVVCAFSAVANFAKYTKLRALNRGDGPDPAAS